MILLYIIEIKEEYLRAEALVDFRPDTDFAYYWKGLGRQNLAVGDVYPYLHFLGEEAGRLQFELRCHYHTSGYGDAGQATFPLSIDLALPSLPSITINFPILFYSPSATTEIVLPDLSFMPSTDNPRS